MGGSPPGSLCMRFPRQEHWSGLLFPSPGDLPDPGIEPRSPALPPEPPGKPCTINGNKSEKGRKMGMKKKKQAPYLTVKY